jgi:hypothetical protein
MGTETTGVCVNHTMGMNDRLEYWNRVFDISDVPNPQELATG